MGTVVDASAHVSGMQRPREFEAWRRRHRKRSDRNDKKAWCRKGTHAVAALPMQADDHPIAATRRVACVTSHKVVYMRRRRSRST